MNISLITVGKTQDDYIKTGIDIYTSRLQHYVSFELLELPAQKNTKNLSPEDIKRREASLITNQLNSSSHIVLLDEHGSQLSSVGFSQFIQKQMNSGVKKLSFVVGGAFGFDPALYLLAHDKLSLSLMTFNHQMVRLFFVEQLYRAFTIIKHEPYHNE